VDTIDTVRSIEAADRVGTGLHQLTGKGNGQWAMTVSQNWRITFYFEDGNAFDVNLEDYHGS